ncbi:MAG: ribonucleoside-triphosphate reductase [Actinobacteria bacterium]|nr:ribonucleoside-triphosphate reductase [Actinomycetota bacterium]
MHEIKKELMEQGKNYPKNFIEKRGNIFLLDFIIAERKAFLRTDRLTYSAKLKIDEIKKEIIFFEILKESGAGLGSGGAGDGYGTGFGFKVEKTKIGPGGREGTIEQQSVLFGKKYEYKFTFEKIRQDIKSLAEKYGYSFTYTLNEREIR